MNQHINHYADKIQYHDNTQYTEKIATKHRRERLWQRVVGLLACLTVFCTTYALVLPAITMSEEFYCGYEEHPEHTEDCYGLVLTCGYAEDSAESGEGENVTDEDGAVSSEGAHEHTDECYEESFSLDEVLGYGSVQNAYRVYTGEDLEDISEIALYSDPAAVAPDYIGSIDMANAWQIEAEEYTGNAKSAKIGDDVDNDGTAEVLVQKNVVPTANENEFLVYLSISKQMSWDTLLAQSTLGLTTQGKWKESDVGTVVNESNIGGNKTNWCSCF